MTLKVTLQRIIADKIMDGFRGQRVRAPTSLQTYYTTKQQSTETVS